MKKRFKFPMKTSERIIGNIYIPVHVFLLPLLLGFLYTNVLSRGDAGLGDLDLNLIYYCISFVFVLVFLFRFLKKSFSDLLDNIVPALQAIALAYFFNYFAVYLVTFLLSFVLDSVANPNTQEIVSQTKLNANAIIVVAVLLAPIVEETLFRGALFGTLRSKSRLLAYIVSTLAFAVYHLWQYFVGGFEWTILLYLLQYIPPSIALCWCYERSGSIWSPIVLHALINFVSIKILIG